MHKNSPLRMLGEAGRLEFRSEWFNVFNHTQFSGFGTTLGTAAFGRITSARDARIGQMALKLYW